MQKSLLPLAVATAYQEKTGGAKTPWRIRENETYADLFELPNTISDEAMFEVLEFARKFELEAFNIGIQFQKGRQDQILMERIARLEAEKNEMMIHSDKLAETVERLTSGD